MPDHLGIAATLTLHGWEGLVLRDNVWTGVYHYENDILVYRRMDSFPTADGGIDHTPNGWLGGNRRILNDCNFLHPGIHELPPALLEQFYNLICKKGYL